MKHLMSTVAWTCLAVAMARPALAADAAADAGANATLAEVIVTATKVETNLQRTPIAISVVSGSALEAKHAESLISLQDGSIPSLRIATFEARQSALTIGIRGIVPFDANQTARDQGVGVYIDGVYLGRQQGLNAVTTTSGIVASEAGAASAANAGDAITMAKQPHEAVDSRFLIALPLMFPARLLARIANLARLAER